MTKAPPPIQILVAVELGSPAAECAHYGICSMEVISPEQWAVFKPRHVRQVKAALTMIDAGNLHFNFPFQSMRADTLTQFFLPEGFRVDADFLLPQSITRLLHLPEDTRIMMGVYLLTGTYKEILLDLYISIAEQALAVDL